MFCLHIIEFNTRKLLYIYSVAVKSDEYCIRHEYDKSYIIL